MTTPKVVVQNSSSSKKPEVIVIESKASTSKSKKRNRKKGKKLARFRNTKIPFQGGKRSMFLMHVVAPDIVGPFRQPRAGASVRSGLGYDQTEVSLASNGTLTVVGVQPTTVYNSTPGVATAWALASETTPLGAGTAVVNGVQFPNVLSVADVNCTAISLVAYYVGNPLTVQGEMLFGNSIPLASNAAYSSNFYLPGVQRVAAAELIAKPLRVSMRKLSPIADEFVGVAVGNADVDVPWIFFSGGPTGGTLKVIITRTWEYRSTTGTGGIIPFEFAADTHNSSVIAYTDARADLASQESTLTEAIPDATGSTLTNLLGLSVPAAAGAGYTAYRLLSHGNKILTSVRGGNQHHVNEETMIPMAQYLDRMFRPEHDEL